MSRATEMADFYEGLTGIKLEPHQIAIIDAMYESGAVDALTAARRERDEFTAMMHRRGSELAAQMSKQMPDDMQVVWVSQSVLHSAYDADGILIDDGASRRAHEHLAEWQAQVDAAYGKTLAGQMEQMHAAIDDVYVEIRKSPPLATIIKVGKRLRTWRDRWATGRSDTPVCHTDVLPSQVDIRNDRSGDVDRG